MWLAWGLCVLVCGCAGGGEGRLDAKSVSEGEAVAAAAPVDAGETPGDDDAGEVAPSRSTTLPLPPIALAPATPESAATGEPGNGAVGPVTATQALATGRRLMQMGRFQEAIEHLRAASEIEPGNASTLRLLGNAQARINNMPAALRTLQNVTAIAPESAGAHFELAMVALNMANTELAGTAARRALELDPESHRAQELVATVLHRRREYAAVLALLEPAVEQQPERNQARYMIGLAYFGLQRMDEARSTLEEVVRRQPDHARAHLNLAEILTRQGDAAGAARARATFQRLETSR